MQSSWWGWLGGVGLWSSCQTGNTFKFQGVCIDFWIGISSSWWWSKSSCGMYVSNAYIALQMGSVFSLVFLLHFSILDGFVVLEHDALGFQLWVKSGNFWVWLIWLLIALSYLTFILLPILDNMSCHYHFDDIIIQFKIFKSSRRSAAKLSRVTLLLIDLWIQDIRNAWTKNFFLNWIPDSFLLNPTYV